MCTSVSPDWLHSPTTSLGTLVQTALWRKYLISQSNGTNQCFYGCRHWSDDFHAQPSLGFTENHPKKKQKNHPVRGCSEWKYLVDDRCQRISDRKAAVTQINTCYNQGLQKGIFENTITLRLMAYSSTTLNTALTKLDNGRLEKSSLVWRVSICDVQRVGSQQTKAWIHPVLYQ